MFQDQSRLEIESSSSSEKLADEDDHPITMTTTSTNQSDPVPPALLATLWKEHTLAKYAFYICIDVLCMDRWMYGWMYCVMLCTVFSIVESLYYIPDYCS